MKKGIERIERRVKLHDLRVLMSSIRCDKAQGSALHRSHFPLDAVNRTGPEPKRLGDPQDTNTLLHTMRRSCGRPHLMRKPTSNQASVATATLQANTSGRIRPQLSKVNAGLFAPQAASRRTASLAMAAGSSPLMTASRHPRKSKVNLMREAFDSV
jgi:hypothetical protein